MLNMEGQTYNPTTKCLCLFEAVCQSENKILVFGESGGSMEEQTYNPTTKCLCLFEAVCQSENEILVFGESRGSTIWRKTPGSWVEKKWSQLRYGYLVIPDSNLDSHICGLQDADNVPSSEVFLLYFSTLALYPGNCRLSFLQSKNYHT